MALKLSLVSKVLASRLIHTSCVNSVNLKWRRERGLPENPNHYGPLSNMPDYTYMDGRPTPLGSRQRGRVTKQREFAEKMVELCGELKFAKDRHQRILKEEETGKQQIIDSKLKPKGQLLLNTNKTK